MRQTQHKADDLLNIARDVVVNPQDVIGVALLKRQFEPAAQWFVTLTILKPLLGEKPVRGKSVLGRAYVK